MSSIHVTINTNTAASANGASGNPTDLAGLQKKLTGLMKELEKASKDMAPGAKERIKLLQVQIQQCEMQIQQLQAAEAQKALLKDSETAGGKEGGAAAKSVLRPAGHTIDTQA